mgnify:CR=1 FL=1
MKRLAIDLGSNITKIYMPGCGVVLMESTCIAVEQYIEDGEKCLTYYIMCFTRKAFKRFERIRPVLRLSENFAAEAYDSVATDNGFRHNEDGSGRRRRSRNTQRNGGFGR